MTRTFQSLEHMASALLFLPYPYYQTSHKLDPLTLFALHNSSSAIVADYHLLGSNVPNKPLIDIALDSVDDLQRYFNFEREHIEINHYPLAPSAAELVEALGIADIFVNRPAAVKRKVKRSVVLSHIEADAIEIIAKIQGVESVTRNDDLSIKLDSALMTAVSLFHSVYHNNLAILHEAIPGLCWHLKNEKKILDAQYALKERRFDDLPEVIQLALHLHVSLQGHPPSVQMAGVISLVGATLHIHPMRRKSLSIAVDHIDSAMPIEGLNIISHLTAPHLTAEAAESIVLSPVFFGHGSECAALHPMNKSIAYEGDKYGERI